MNLFGPKGPDPEVIRRIQQWTRDILNLPEVASILVHEIRCDDPGCPPHGTVIGILAEGQPSFKVQIPLPAAAVMRPRLERALQKAIEAEI